MNTLDECLSLQHIAPLLTPTTRFPSSLCSISMDSLEQRGVPLLAPHAAAVQACVGELRQCLASLGSLARQELAVDAAADLVLSLVRAPDALPVILPPNRANMEAQQ